MRTPLSFVPESLGPAGRCPFGAGAEPRSLQSRSRAAVPDA